MWKNAVEQDRPQMTIWRVRNSCFLRLEIHAWNV